MRRDVVALLIALLLFNTGYSFFHHGTETSPLRNPSVYEVAPSGASKATFNLTPMRIGDAKTFSSRFYASLASMDGSFNFTQTLHATGETRVEGYATREDAYLNPTPAIMVVESLRGTMKTRVVAQGEERGGEGQLEILARRFLSLQDLRVVRIELNEEYTTEGSRGMTEVATLYPEGESYRTLLLDALENLSNLQEGVTYSVKRTLDPSPLPLPPASLNLLLDVNVSGSSAHISFRGSSGGLMLRGWVELEEGYHYPRGVNLTLRGTFGDYRVLLTFEERALGLVSGSGELISIPPSEEISFSEILPFQHIPAPGEGYNLSLYGGTPGDVLRAVEGFLEERNEELLKVHRVAFQLNTTATSPLWNISLSTPSGRYYIVVDPADGEVQSFGEDGVQYLGGGGVSEGITLSYHHRLLRRAAPEGFFTVLGEPNPTMKIYFYRESPLMALPVRLPLPLPCEGGFFLSVAADPKDPGRLLFISVSLVDGRILATGSVKGEVL